MLLRRLLLAPLIGLLVLGVTSLAGPLEGKHAQAQAPEGMAGLENGIAAAIEGSGINAAVSVTDLQTGETISYRGDEPRLAGCTLNYFVLLQATMDLQEGRYQEPPVGDLISRTVFSSNPVTARDLLLVIGNGSVGRGISRVGELMDSLGMSTSIYDHAPAYVHESQYGSANFLTTNETNRGLAALWNGEVLNSDWRSYLLDKMTGSKPGLKYLIPAGVGDGIVSHKIGFFHHPNGTWVDADAGIVRFQRGGNTYAYAISFFAQDIPSEYADIPLGQEVSSIAWQFFNQRYP